MNQTEKLAYKWLTEKLKRSNVHFQRHNSPDFTLSGETESYEVKRLYGHSIWFYENQFQKLQKLKNCKIIVIEDNNPEPVTLIPISEAKANTVTNNILIRVVPQIVHIPICPETKQELNKIGPKVAKKLRKKSVSYDEIIRHLAQADKNDR